jgi:hypothetical protein
VVVRINAKRSAFARRAPLAVEPEGAFEVVRATLWTHADGVPRINTKLRTATQAQMLGIVANATREAFVIRVIGVLLLTLLINVVRVAIRPRDDGVSAIVTNVLKRLCHVDPFRVEQMLRMSLRCQLIISVPLP